MKVVEGVKEGVEEQKGTQVFSQMDSRKSRRKATKLTAERHTQRVTSSLLVKTSTFIQADGREYTICTHLSNEESGIEPHVCV